MKYVLLIAALLIASPALATESITLSGEEYDALLNALVMKDPLMSALIMKQQEAQKAAASKKAAITNGQSVTDPKAKK
jgi:hypothetical protein